MPRIIRRIRINLRRSVAGARNPLLLQTRLPIQDRSESCSRVVSKWHCNEESVAVARLRQGVAHTNVVILLGQVFSSWSTPTVHEEVQFATFSQNARALTS